MMIMPFDKAEISLEKEKMLVTSIFLFSQYFHKASFAGLLKIGIV